MRVFLSTPSARRATVEAGVCFLCPQRFLSTPSARRATTAEGTGSGDSGNFYPRPPRGGRLLSSFTSSGEKVISIHALREEGDGRKGGRPRKAKDFYPRPPRGGRQGLIYDMMDTTAFLSTPSARRATDQTVWPLPSRHISIHALREEGDCKNGEKHLRFCFIIKRSAQIWKSLSKNIRKKSRDLHRTA